MTESKVGIRIGALNVNGMGGPGSEPKRKYVIAKFEDHRVDIMIFSDSRVYTEKARNDRLLLPYNYWITEPIVETTHPSRGILILAKKSLDAEFKDVIPSADGNVLENTSNRCLGIRKVL